MIQVICPVCGAALEPQGTAWRCAQGHCFDVARQGYVNLLTVTQKQNAGRYTSISWTRDGFDYILYSQKPEMNMVSGLAVPFITNTRAEET